MKEKFISKKYILVIAVFAGFIFAACNNKAKEKMIHQANPDDKGTNLQTLLKPTDQFAISDIPVTVPQTNGEPAELKALGFVAYDTREIGTISARISGRIEKLYVKYRYENVSAGQKIMEIYSPEILTAQRNLIFLLKNDSSNIDFIRSAKDKLLLLGMSREQLEQVEKKHTALFTIAVYSRYNGHIHDAPSVMMNSESQSPGTMNNSSVLTSEIQLKEGMYVSKGQTIFSVYNPSKAWALLNLYADNQDLVQKGNTVLITPETVPGKAFQGKIDFIEPVFRNENKTVTARVYFDNSRLQIPVGSQLKALINTGTIKGMWLPKTATVSLGLAKVVFIKQRGGFMAHKVETGFVLNDKVQITGGLNATDTVAVNGQYLIDSESFIKSKE